MAEARIKVAIIGAGFAGLGATQRLLSDPRFDVRVLEGSSKVGGRAKSVCLSGSYTAELGCRFLYFNHEGGEPLAEYAERKGLVSSTESDLVRVEITTTPSKSYLSNGEQLPHDQVTHYKEIYVKIQNELTERARRGDWSYVIDNKWPEESTTQNPQEFSYEDYMAQRFQSVTASDQIGVSGPTSWKPKHVMEHMNVFESFENGTMRSKRVHFSQYGDYFQPEGHYILTCSYQELAESITNDIPPDCIHLNSEVQSIHWLPGNDSLQQGTSSTETPVTIVCTDGTTHHVDHVIVTVSLGVLQQRCHPTSPIPFFIPQLPEDKLSSIMKLGMGKGAKVIFKFSQPLVDGPHKSIQLYWLEKDFGYPERYQWATKLDVLRRIEDSCIYVALFTGESAVAVENAKDSEIAEGICIMLEKFLKKAIDRPIHIEKSNWCQNKLFLGSYTYNTHENSRQDRVNLTKPLNGLQVLFAGEATHLTRFSTTHGAYESGIREANRLFEYYI